MAGTKGRACDGKIRHDSKDDAQAAIASLVRNRGAIGGKYRVYRCRWCGYWHHGHRPGSRRKR